MHSSIVRTAEELERKKRSNVRFYLSFNHLSNNNLCDMEGVGVMEVFNNLRAILTRHKENMPVVVVAEMLAEIDGAEADCCEWKYTGHLNEYAEAHELSVGALKIIGWKFCPICGKPIKISEVE